MSNSDAVVTILSLVVGVLGLIVSILSIGIARNADKRAEKAEKEAEEQRRQLQQLIATIAMEVLPNLKADPELKDKLARQLGARDYNHLTVKALELIEFIKVKKGEEA